MTAPFNTTYADGGPPITGDGLNTFIQVCETVDTARGFIGTQGMAMFLTGYAAMNDGGQGPFFWNPLGTAQDDNGVTTIVPFGSAPGAGEWTRAAIGPTQQVNVRQFVNSGTYIPSPGLSAAIFELVGGGGGGGGAIGSTTGLATGGGGGSGAYTKVAASLAQIGSGLQITIGTGGAGGPGNGQGGGGGETILAVPGGAVLATAPGASGGFGSSVGNGSGGGRAPFGSGTLAGFYSGGADGDSGVQASIITVGGVAGAGGNGPFGGAAGGGVFYGVGAVNGGNAASWGAGGAGGGAVATSSNATGGNGFGGTVIVTELIG